MAKPQLVTSPATSVLTNSNGIEFMYDTIAQAFPEVEPGLKPYGTNVLCQIRHAKMFTSGGIKLPDEARSTEYYNTQVAKVVALGSMCFKTVKEVRDGNGGVKDVIVPWVQEPWFKLGDFVRLPKYGGDRFTVKFEYNYEPPAIGSIKREQITETSEVIFALFKTHEVLGLITADPRAIRAYLD